MIILQKLFSFNIKKKFDQTKDMFLLNSTLDVDIRNQNKFKVQPAKHSRLLTSSIPQLQKAVNNDR